MAPTMGAMTALAGILVLILLIYLGVALFSPERFS